MRGIDARDALCAAATGLCAVVVAWIVAAAPPVETSAPALVAPRPDVSGAPGAPGAGPSGAAGLPDAGETEPTPGSAAQRGRSSRCFRREREGTRFVDAADTRTTAPEPAAIRDGPFVRELYSDGATHFETERVLGPGGEWIRHGSWSSFHENGAQHELGRYRLGVEDGPWEWSYPNGERMAAGAFVDGERDGPWALWNEDGGLNMTGSYVGGVRTGRWSVYRPNGLLRAQGSYSNDELSGPWTYWHRGGTVDLERSGTYSGGVRVGD